MQQVSTIKGWLLIAVVSVVAVPLCTLFFLYPSCSGLIAGQVGHEAVQLATHLFNNNPAAATLTRESLPPDFSRHVDQAVTDFGLLQVTVFTPAGDIVFSMDWDDDRRAGTIGSFPAQVTSGKAHTRLHTIKQRPVGGQATTLEVAESFVPIMQGDMLVGAMAITTDITDRKQELAALLTRLAVTLFLVVFCLVAALIIIGLKVDRRISRQLQSKEDLRRELDFMQTVLNTVSTVVVVLDKEFRIAFVNRQGEQVSGYSQAEVRGRHPWDFLLLPTESKQVEKGYNQLMQSKQTSRVEHMWLTKAGEQRLMSWTNSILADKNGVPQHIISTGIDITESQQVSSLLGQTKEDWETIFNAIDEAIIINDKNMNVIQANTAAHEILGLAPPDIVGQKCYTLLHGSSHPPEDCLSCATLKTGQPAVAEIFEPHLQKHLKVKAYPRVDEQNNIIGRIHIISDISKRKISEEEQQKLHAQLLQSQKLEAIGQLAGGVAHDFNNLLTGILGFVGLARDQVEENSPISADLGETLELARRASDLTRQLLAFSRRQILEPEPVSLNDLVRNMSKMLKRLLGEDITFDFQPAPKLDRVSADPGQMEQVLVNLAINSRQAMPQGGTLKIETGHVMLDEAEIRLRRVDVVPGPYVRLIVADTGIGIEKSIQELIFDPFFTTKEVGIGSGLGLSTVYGIIKQHNGFIWVDSAPGKGAVFTIYLPVAEQALSIEERDEPPVVATRSATVLVVEDDAAVLQVMERMLSQLGYTVLAATEPDDAEALFDRNKEEVTLLVTDVIMPKKSGIELYNTLAQRVPHLQVLYMSGHTQDMLVQKGVLGSECAFIKKPFSQENLGSKIQALISGSADHF
jgi:PAS domain S-box-containing protein